jgi:HlyD family secretion protein
MTTRQTVRRDATHAASARGKATALVWVAELRWTAALAAAAVLGLAAMAAPSGCGRNASPNPSGTFEAVTVDLSPTIAGRILAVGAREGERVQAGDTLLVLDTELVALKRAETAAGRESLRAQRQVAQADLSAARRQLALLETTLARVSNLLAEGSATQQQVDDLSAERDLARNRLEGAQGRLAVIDSDLARADAALAVADRQLEDGVLVAPIAGTVLVRAAEPGELATPGLSALRLAKLSELELRIYLEATDLDRVRIGQELPVIADARPGEPLTGRVTWISDEAEFTPKNAQTRNTRAQLVYAVKLAVANPDDRLHIGMPAEVKLP